MSDKIRADARHIKKLIREAEALSDEAMVACARLKQAMIHARQNPEVPIDTGQKAIMRLLQAEQNAVSLSSSLLRVHEELNKVARVTCGTDEETDLRETAAIDEASASIAA